jgi:hypothetical protein
VLYLVRVLSYLHSSDQGVKTLPGTNILIYLVATSVTNVKKSYNFDKRSDNLHEMYFAVNKVSDNLQGR